MDKKLINIAIDGPSGAGKSTISDVLASKLGYVHLDTGAMYRSVALYCVQNEIDLEDEDVIADKIGSIELDLRPDGKVFMNGSDVSLAIRENEISMVASSISRFAKVREALVKKQQNIASNKGYIVDGRDIGTVVLKDAEVKFYLTASAEGRAMRRVKQYAEKGIEADYKTILEDIIKRDYQDMNRSNSPLKQAEDAILIDTSSISVEEVVDLCIDHINKILK